MKRTILTLTMVVASSVCTQGFGFDLLDRMLGMKGCGSSTACCEAPVCEPTCGLEAPCGGCDSDFGCAPACEPDCGCEAPCGGCDSGCGLLKGNLLGGCNSCAEPTCGCEIADCGCAPACEPACGCEIAACEPSCCDSGCSIGKGGLLSKLFNGKGCNSCCEAPCEIACEPACGCEIASCEPTCCDSGCDSGCCSIGNGGLLKKLFGNLGCKKSSCCDMGCDAAPCDTGCGCGSTYAAPTAAPVVAPQAAPMPPAPIVDPSASISRNRRVIQASASYVR